MERFYDHVMPEYCEKLARPWNERPHLTTILCRPKGRYLVAEGKTWRIYQNEKPISSETFRYDVQVREGVQIYSVMLSTPIHRLNLPSAMKETILADGIPLYGNWR